MFFRTVRWRLTLWYALTLAVIMAASGVFWHLYLSRNLLRQTDERLLIVAKDIQAMLGENPPDSGTCRDLQQIIERHRWTYHIQISQGTGRVACVSDSLGDLRLPLEKGALQHAVNDSPYFESISSGSVPSLRLLSYPVNSKGRLLGIVQVASDLQEVDHTLENLRLFFLIYSPLVLFILCLGGWFLAGRALSPMTRMARVARQINADNLSLRLPVEHPGDEIAQLAESANTMLARLEESFRKVKQFSGDASHELRTPLAILRGETEVTLRWARDAEDYRRALESNLEEISRMGRIIDDLLTLAKSDAGELPLEVKSISLSDLLQELYMAGNTLGEGKGIRVNLHLDVAEEIRIQGDELRLRQMFLNLISNAIKYTPEEGRVDIALTMQGEEAVVSVSDTGIGIPAEHVPHIFDRFYRIDKARNRADGGTGLGLAITKGIIEAHAGRIAVSSVSGQGSTFTVHLPVSGPPRGKLES